MIRNSEWTCIADSAIIKKVLVSERWIHFVIKWEYQETVVLHKVWKMRTKIEELFGLETCEGSCESQVVMDWKLRDSFMEQINLSLWRVAYFLILWFRPQNLPTSSKKNFFDPICKITKSKFQKISINIFSGKLNLNK